MNTAQSTTYCGCDEGARYTCERHAYSKCIFSAYEIRTIRDALKQGISFAEDVNCGIDDAKIALDLFNNRFVEDDQDEV